MKVIRKCTQYLTYNVTAFLNSENSLNVSRGSGSSLKYCFNAPDYKNKKKVYVTSKIHKLIL